jgi:hypothetical protein
MTGRALAIALLITPFTGVVPVWAASTNPLLLSTTDLGALSAPPSVQPPAPPSQASVITGLQPAPLPNPDADGPRESTGLGPGLTPALFHEKAVFQGNGYSPASDLEHGVNERRTPAAGLNWTLPVK